MSKTKNTGQLGQEAQAFFDAVNREYELSDHDTALLRRACVHLDAAGRLDALIREHGEVVKDRWGQVKANPAVELRNKADNTFRLLVRELGLDHPDSDAIGRPPRLQGGR